MSRPATISTGWPVRWSTMTCFTVVGGCDADWSAASTFFLSGNGAPRRQPPSAVITATAWASWLRSAIASLENPPKITECTAPIRAQPSIAITSSGVIGM